MIKIPYTDKEVQDRLKPFEKRMKRLAKDLINIFPEVKKWEKSPENENAIQMTSEYLWLLSRVENLLCSSFQLEIAFESLKGVKND